MEVAVMGATLLDIQESSVFSWNAGAMLPVAYRYKQSGLNDSRQQISFNHTTRSITSYDDGEVTQLPLEPGIMDKLGYQLVLREAIKAQDTELTFTVVDGDEIEAYEFRIDAPEVVETPVGKLNTIKVERVYEAGSERQTVFWLAKDWQFLLVKFVQVRGNESSTELMLQKAHINGVQVTGLP